MCRDIHIISYYHILSDSKNAIQFYSDVGIVDHFPSAKPSADGRLDRGILFQHHQITRKKKKLTRFSGLSYPLVNVYIAMENHHVSWGKSTISTGSFSIVMLNYQRVSVFESYPLVIYITLLLKMAIELVDLPKK